MKVSLSPTILQFIFIPVVNILTSFGVFWNVNTTIMGILILAPANSIGDFVADFGLSKIGKVETAMGAIYAGPLMNVLIGVGLGYLVFLAIS